MCVEGEKHDCVCGKESSGGPGHFRGRKLRGHHEEFLHFQRRFDTRLPRLCLFGLYTVKNKGIHLDHYLNQTRIVSLSLRSWWHLQLRRLHYLSWRRWNSAVCIVALPGIQLGASKIHLCGFLRPAVWPTHPVPSSFLAGERSTSYGLPPGLPGLPDAFQIWHLPVSGHPDYWRYRPLTKLSVTLWTAYTLLACAPFFFTRHLDVFIFHVGNAAIVLRSRLKVRVLKENWETKARVDENGIILTNGDIDGSWKAVQYQVTSATSSRTLANQNTLTRSYAPWWWRWRSLRKQSKLERVFPGAEWSGGGQGTLLVSFQCGPVPGWTPHYYGAGRRWVELGVDGCWHVRLSHTLFVSAGRGLFITRCMNPPTYYSCYSLQREILKSDRGGSFVRTMVATSQAPVYETSIVSDRGSWVIGFQRNWNDTV